MKILFVTNAYPPAIGGAEVASKRIVDILATKHHVTVLTRKDGFTRTIDKEKEIVELESKTVYSYMPKLTSFLNTNEFDMYISFGFGKYFFDTIGAWCKKKRKKCISLPIGYFHTKSALLFKKAYHHFKAATSLDNYDALITATQQEKNFWATTFGIEREKIKVIPHTLEEGYTTFRKSEILQKHNLTKKKYIFYIGRLAKNKRPDLLITAFDHINQSQVKLVIAGRGTKTPALENLAQKNVIFLGDITDDEKKELISQARFCVFPSEYESYGLFIPESLELGTPIIVSNIPVFKEIMTDSQFLFDNTVESLEKKLKEFIQKPIFFKGYKRINQKEAYLQIVNQVHTTPKKINILMQYAWVVADSPYYKFLFDTPPQNAHYLNPIISSRDVTTNAHRIKRFNSIKDLIRAPLIKGNIPLPNVRLPLSNNQTELIHATHCISATTKPWVVDFEGLWQTILTGTNNTLAINLARKFLKKSNCKKIICWTNTTKQEFIKKMNDPLIINKLCVVYPACPAQEKIKIKKAITLVFIARYFNEKGGDTALEVIDALTKKYDKVQGIVVSNTPPEILTKYARNKKITFYPLLPRKELFEKAYKKSTIFVYPGYSDSFGFMFLEAMAFGLPIVTVNGIARTEIIRDGINGFVVPRNPLTQITARDKEYFAQEMIKKTEKLITNVPLLKKISSTNYADVATGRFSIKQKNQQMEEIYEDAITKNA